VIALRVLPTRKSAPPLRWKLIRLARPSALLVPICKKRRLARYRFSNAKSRRHSTGTGHSPAAVPHSRRPDRGRSESHSEPSTATTQNLVGLVVGRRWVPVRLRAGAKVRRSAVRSGLSRHVWSEGDGETRTPSAIRSVLTGLERAGGCGWRWSERWQRPVVTAGRGECGGRAYVICWPTSILQEPTTSKPSATVTMRVGGCRARIRNSARTSIG
jgi:hypothetical protein